MGRLQRGRNPIFNRCITISTLFSHRIFGLVADNCFPPLIGRLNQAEFSERVDPLLASTDGSKEHLHNQLIAAIYGNVTREIPEQGLAPWVSANDKPSATAGSKPVSGDATERRLKGEVMQLPSRDRRRIKDLAQNDVCCVPGFFHFSVQDCIPAKTLTLFATYSSIRMRAWPVSLPIIVG